MSKSGDKVEIYLVDDLLFKKVEVPIIYRDENVVVFNKPKSLEVTGNNSLCSYAKKLFENKFVEPCHRLDRNTTGLVLFALNKKSLEELLLAFKNKSIEKHYICVVSGIPAKKNEELHSFLFKDAKKSTVYISDTPKKGYKTIITSYTTLKANMEKNISLLDVALKTGRTHQIRAHLAHIGHPIIGDGKYGNNQINKAFNEKNQLLTSYKLIFHLPPSSSLSYLNNIKISLPENQFKKII